MGDARPLTCLQLVAQWPQPAIKSVACALTTCFKLLCNAKCDDGDAQSAHLRSSFGRVSVVSFSHSDLLLL
jgi:hypothetical protein